MVALDYVKSGLSGGRALVISAVILFVELLFVGSVFKHSIDFECLGNWPAWACSGASGAMIAVYCAMGALAVTLMLRPEPFRVLLQGANGAHRFLGLNLAGTALALVPILLLREGDGASMMWPALSIWAIALTLMIAGLVLFVAPLERWRSFLDENWQIVLPVTAIGLATPYLASMIRPAWLSIDFIADVTFSAVAWITQLMGYEIDIYPEDKIIGAEGFYINIAPVCSGIEGMVLVTLFVTIYLSLFRSELRFPMAFLLFPIGIALSAMFNVVRITVLLIIGLEGNEELAVGGFHSHAGWLMFTVVSIGLIALAQAVPALRKTPVVTPQSRPQLVPLRQDPVSACILPFAVFMLSALLVSAFASQPALAYPLRALAMAGALAVFWPFLSKLEWRPDALSLLIGAAIGAMWVMIPVEQGPAPYGTLAGAWLVGWFVARGLGTIILVPVIEELFFRKYLERKLRLRDGLLWKIIPALIIAAIFAVLHDRWVEAVVASLAFSYVMARRERVEDVIVSHATANAIVFGTALTTGNLSMI